VDVVRVGVGAGEGVADDVEGVGDPLVVVVVYVDEELVVAVGGEGELEVGLTIAGFEAAGLLDAAPGLGEGVADAAGFVEVVCVVTDRVEQVVVQEALD
jgi:hypothetical protein